MEESVVGPVAVNCSSETSGFIRAQETPIIGVLAPANAWVDFYPAVGELTELNHLDHYLDGQLWQLLNLNDAVDNGITAELSAKQLPILVGGVGDDQLQQFGKWTVCIVHRLCKNMHSAAEESSVVLFGCLCEMEDILNCCVIVDLLEDLCGKLVDRHDGAVYYFLLFFLICDGISVALNALTCKLTFYILEYSFFLHS